MPTRGARALLAGAVVIALVGCGGSHSASSKSATPTAPAGANTQTTPATGALALSGRVLLPATFPGLVVVTQPMVTRSAADWAASVEQSASRAREAARLQRLGFLGGINESLHGTPPVMAESISIVEQYRSPVGARGELAYQVAQARSGVHAHGAKFRTFPVTGIPGAVGWDASDPHNVGLNIFFADGPFYYVVAAGYPPDAHGAPTRGQLLTAATSLYRRVHGRPAT